LLRTVRRSLGSLLGTDLVQDGSVKTGDTLFVEETADMFEGCEAQTDRLRYSRSIFDGGRERKLTVCATGGLLEELWLSGRFVDFSEVAEADTDEAEALVRPKVHTLSQLECSVGQLLAGRGRRARSKTARENIELACLQFKDHGMWDSQFIS